jgi:lipopolysaccharide export LptBFGC system permease protein LptF
MTPSPKLHHLILFLTALVCSRTMFVSFDDPEGPNLLVIFVGAAVIFAASWVAGRFVPVLSSQKGLPKIFAAIVIQVIFTLGLYFLLR